ncbi:type II restriction endonuclease [Campylobacter sp. faydin G-140]|nr:type II restriction endonuclease [Campylobacter anatolicus]MBR8462818.1 type II restriction endonuclease [Campylobacter anatolicus]MBR8465920.1 type II restriction endonuclease [Campylobacter anatolicus]
MVPNKTSFTDFLNSLIKTNAGLDYFCDFAKCSENLKEVEIKLNSLNFLLNKSDLRSAIEALFNENKKCFSILNLLIAVRDQKTNVLDKNFCSTELDTFFEDPEKIYYFFKETGLEQLFKNGRIRNLCDYFFGIEVGLDTNARKNRRDKIMESYIAEIFKKNNIDFAEQVKTSKLHIDLGRDVKKFDFTIKSRTTTYLIETNFYNTGGSKLNEVATAYIEISNKIKYFKEFEFAWITDGCGWLEAKNKLKEAYNSVEIYNLTNINEFIEKIKND